MPRMHVKPYRPSPWLPLVWCFHCPGCPDWPSVAYPTAAQCHDAALDHADGCHWLHLLAFEDAA